MSRKVTSFAADGFCRVPDILGGIVGPQISVISIYPPSRGNCISLNAGVSCVRDALSCYRMGVTRMGGCIPHARNGTLGRIDRFSCFIRVSRPLPRIPSIRLGSIRVRVNGGYTTLIGSNSYVRLKVNKVPSTVYRRLGAGGGLKLRSRVINSKIISLLGDNIVGGSVGRARGNGAVLKFTFNAEGLFSCVSSGPSIRVCPVRCIGCPPGVTGGGGFVSVGSYVRVSLVNRIITSAVNRVRFSKINNRISFMENTAVDGNNLSVVTVASAAGRSAVSGVIPAVAPNSTIAAAEGSMGYIIARCKTTVLGNGALGRETERLVGVTRPGFESRLYGTFRREFGRGTFWLGVRYDIFWVVWLFLFAVLGFYGGSRFFLGILYTVVFVWVVWAPWTGGRRG